MRNSIKALMLASALAPTNSCRDAIPNKKSPQVEAIAESAGKKALDAMIESPKQGAGPGSPEDEKEQLHQRYGTNQGATTSWKAAENGGSLGCVPLTPPLDNM